MKRQSVQFDLDYARQVIKGEAAAIEYAVDSALGSGARTADIATAGERVISTHAMGEAIAAWVCQVAGQTQRSLRAEE